MEGSLEIFKIKESVDRFHENKHQSVLKKMINLFDAEWLDSKKEHISCKLIERQDVINEMEVKYIYR